MKSTATKWLLLTVLLCLSIANANAVEVSADLSWQAPTARADGTPLAADEIAGYRIYSSDDGASFQALADINDGTALGYHLALDLPISASPVTVYYVVTAYDNWNRESGYSNVASRIFEVASTAPPETVIELRLSVTCSPDCEVRIIQQSQN